MSFVDYPPIKRHCPTCRAIPDDPCQSANGSNPGNPLEYFHAARRRGRTE